MLTAPTSASDSPDRWEPPPNQRPRLTWAGDVVRVLPAGASPDMSPGHHRRDRHASAPEPVVVVVKTDGSNGPIPSEGFLLSHIGGELGPLRAERFAVRRFLNDQGFNPHLADWMVDVRNAAVQTNGPQSLTGAMP